MNIEEEITARDLLADYSAPLKEILECKRTIYLGIDPTADSLHVGHLVLLLMMKRLGVAGHSIIFLVGGATGMIGDPKEKGERQMIDKRTVQKNTNALKKQIKSILGNVSFRMVDNAKWLSYVLLIDFLRDIGKYFTVNELIKHDTIRKRLEKPNESISYTEFTYALLQGYDYLLLNKKYGCDLQIGGADQWTNILSGVELTRRKYNREVYAFTVPLITDALGNKFGKSEGNAVWLDPKKTSPFVFYQFWANLPDEKIETYLKSYTFLSLADIDSILITHRISPNKRIAQNTLAKIVTEIIHGKTTAENVAAASKAIFGNISITSLSHKARDIILNEVLTYKISNDTTIVDALFKSGLTSSKSNARRLIEGKGISLNGNQVLSDRILVKNDFTENIALLKKGKRDVLVLNLK